MIDYPASGAYVKYSYLASDEIVKMKIEGNPEKINLEILLPDNRKPDSVIITGGNLKSQKFLTE